MWLWALIVGMYLSVKQICRWVPQTPRSNERYIFGNHVKFQGFLTAPASFCGPSRFDVYVMCGAAQLWRTRGCPEVWLLQGTHIDLSNTGAV